MKEIKLLEDAELKRLGLKEGHHYRIGSEIYPSSTTILSVLRKPAIEIWAVKTTVEYLGRRLNDVINGKIKLNSKNAYKLLMDARREHQAIKEKAAHLGRGVHKIIELTFKSELNTSDLLKVIDSNYYPAVTAFLNWKSSHDIKALGNEEIVYHEKLKYAGTLDFRCEFNGEKYIVDFKTSKRIYPEMLLQLASYKHAYEFMHPEDIGYKVGILRLDKNSKGFEWKTWNEDIVSIAWNAFKYLVKYYHEVKLLNGNI